DDPVALCGLLEFLHAAKRPIPHAVSKLGAHDDPFVRQSAVLFLARQAPDALLARLATGGDEVRLAATLATAFRIWEAAEKVTELPEGSSIALEKHLVLNHPDGRIDLRELKVPVGTFMLSDWWKSPDVRAEQAGNVGRLRTALRDKDSRVALAAAVGLFFLDDAPSNDAITPILARNKVVLSIGVSKASKKDQAKALAALEKATLSTSTDIPAAFRDIDWDKDTKTGDPGKGKVLFTERGCIACHLAPDDGMGGAIGPTLVGVGERFAPSYLAASMLVPNLTVSPNFHPNTITMKDGTVHTGYVEQGGNPAMLKLRVITGQIVELNKQEIVKQDASEQSMMPAGLIQTPDELRDMIAFLQVGAMKKGAAQANEDAAAKRKQQRKRKRLQPNTKSGARLAPTSVHPSSAGKPNIVLILADDFGWGDASCNHPDSPIPTPAIDRIAEEGIRFTNAHTPSSVCTPTRYGVLTGRYPWRTYLKEAVLPYYAPALITADQTTLASYLRSQGYRSGGFGKWHLGLDWTPVEGDPADWRSHWDTREAKVAAQVAKGIDHSAPFRNGPTDVGFDTYFGTPSNCTRLPFFIKDDRVRGDPKPDASGIPRDPACARDKVDDLYVDRAITFMKSHRKAHADRPFFVYLPLNAIHGATAVPERFGGKSGIGQREDKILWANQSVDRILAALTELNLDDNTLVIFTTDNGPIQSRAGADKGHHATGPYRGLKTSVWDGGSRVPFIARWPGKIPPGTSSDQLIGLTDLLATFAAICGAPLPAGAGTDSFNQLPALLQQTDAIIARSPLVTASYKGLLTLRDDRWKAVFGTKWAGGFPSARYGGIPPKGTPKNDPSIGQLYDLSADPGEQNDLWDSHPEVIEGLRQKLEAIKVLEEHEAPVEATPLEEDFVPIFNGTDLGDWDGRDGAWVVKEGAIVCTGAEKTRNWIVWRKAQPANFMLRLDFKWDNGNSGVQVRSDDLGDHQIFGYQVEIATQSKMGLWHHSLLGKEDPAHAARFFMATAGEEVVIDAEGRKTARRVAPAEDIVAHYEDHQWNRLEIIADGNTLIQKINGVEFSKVTDADARMSRKKGFIALQDHGKGCQVAFRNLRIKRLP
ncbi:MAG: arylsulfatase A, partial [Kiritimatiellia bacterium]